MATPPAHTQPLNAVLAALAAELDVLAADGVRLQDLIGALATRGAAPLDEGLLQDLQAAYGLAQRLAALAGFVRVLGEDAALAGCVDLERALATLSLSDLASRLGRDNAIASRQVAASGDCELF